MPKPSSDEHLIDPPGRPRNARESVRDLDHAIEEMARARHELEMINTSDESRARLRAMYVEPMARLELVRRYILSVQKRHRFKPGRA